MKKVLLSIFTLIFIISMMTAVNAATGSISVVASSNQVVKGNTFTVTIAGNADENITGLEAKLSYDNTQISLESKAAGKGFTDASGSNSEIAILSTDNNSLAKTGTLYTLTFKVLDTAKEGDTTISVTGATLALLNASQAQENVAVTDGSATVKIKADDTTVGDKDNTDKKENTTNTNTSKDKNNTSNKKQPSKKLPQTGVETVSIIAIAGLSVFAVISYVAYKKYKNI